MCRYYFPCQRWLASGEDDGQIARELVPVDKSLKRLDRKDSFAVRNQIALETKGKFSVANDSTVGKRVNGGR